MFESAKKIVNQYESLGFSENPFQIAPLFKNFKNLSVCQEHEKLFIPPVELASYIPILVNMKNRRVLFYGSYGVGKTTFVDSLLYFKYHYHKHFCVRIILTEQNVQKAINELLLALCFEIVEEINNQTLSKPVLYFKKLLAQKRYNDTLLSNLARLVGNYTEIEEKITHKNRKETLNVQPAGIGIQYSLEKDVEIRKSIQSYVETLPMRTIGRYLNQFLDIIAQIGFSDIVIFIDEADHISKIDEFIKMLTRSREVLFEEGYTFFISGSLEIAHYTESIGSIFDKTLFIEPAKFSSFCDILEKRARSVSSSAGLEIFSPQALQAIYEFSKGICKQFLRMAENALDLAAISGATKIELAHVLSTTQQNQDRISDNLGTSQRKVLDALATLGASSPSGGKLQEKTNLTRSSLAKILNTLEEQNYVICKKQGRQTLYSISSLFLPYFKKPDSHASKRQIEIF